jgi:hypothetical protein
VVSLSSLIPVEISTGRSCVINVRTDRTMYFDLLLSTQS